MAGSIGVDDVLDLSIVSFLFSSFPAKNTALISTLSFCLFEGSFLDPRMRTTFKCFLLYKCIYGVWARLVIFLMDGLFFQRLDLSERLKLQSRGSLKYILIWVVFVPSVLYCSQKDGRCNRSFPSRNTLLGKGPSPTFYLFEIIPDGSSCYDLWILSRTPFP